MIINSITLRMKKHYETPVSVVTQVRLESPICGGSATIQNPQGAGYEIEDQKINESFDYTPDGSDWDIKQ